MDFTPYVEDKVIREAVLHRLDKPLLNPPKTVWRNSAQTQNSPPTFQIGKYIR